MEEAYTIMLRAIESFEKMDKKSRARFLRQFLLKDEFSCPSCNTLIPQPEGTDDIGVEYEHTCPRCDEEFSFEVDYLRSFICYLKEKSQ